MDNLHISIDKKDTPTHSVVTTHTVMCILTYNVNTSTSVKNISKNVK